MKKLPKTIYVTLEKDGNKEYLLAWKSLEDVNEDAEVVGVYELKQTGELKVSRELI